MKILSIILFFSFVYCEKVVAVSDFKTANVSKTESEVIASTLTSHLFRQKKFQVVYRNDIQKILQEQAFQQSGCTDTSCAVELGKILNATHIVVGEISYSKRFGYSLQVHMVNVEKGSIVISPPVLMGRSFRSLINNLNLLTLNLCGKKTFTTSKRKKKIYYTAIERKRSRYYKKPHMLNLLFPGLTQILAGDSKLGFGILASATLSWTCTILAAGIALDTKEKVHKVRARAFAWTCCGTYFSFIVMSITHSYLREYRPLSFAVIPTIENKNKGITCELAYRY